MFDKLIDFLIQFGKDLLPFVIVEQWNGAVHLRFGKFVSVRYPGIHLKLPFFDSIIFEVSTEDSAEDNYRISPGDSQK